MARLLTWWSITPEQVGARLPNGSFLMPLQGSPAPTMNGEEARIFAKVVDRLRRLPFDSRSGRRVRPGMHLIRYLTMAACWEWS
jgi:hypothetical protein